MPRCNGSPRTAVLNAEIEVKNGSPWTAVLHTEIELKNGSPWTAVFFSEYLRFNFFEYLGFKTAAHGLPFWILK